MCYTSFSLLRNRPPNVTHPAKYCTLFRVPHRNLHGVCKHMMYTITKGPSKLVTQRRTGPTQQTDNKINDFKHKQTPWVKGSPAPKLVFNGLNKKRNHTPPTPQEDSQAEGFTAAHEDNVKFVFEAWQEVEQQLEDGGESESVSGPVQYSEKTPNPTMKNFVPFDLEEWWAQCFLANIK